MATRKIQVDVATQFGTKIACLTDPVMKAKLEQFAALIVEKKPSEAQLDEICKAIAREMKFHVADVRGVLFGALDALASGK